jgi:hypothetical protein
MSDERIHPQAASGATGGPGATGATGGAGSSSGGDDDGSQNALLPLPRNRAMVLSDWDDGSNDPWFRDETRVPETGPPYPDWARDPLTPQLVDTARGLLAAIVRGVWGPASYALQQRIWQWKKFDLLDWLRPLELLLRRMLLIEAFALAGSQTLPHGRAGIAAAAGAATPARPKPRPAKPSFDPAHPETWRVSFHALPARSRSGPRRKLPPVQPDRQFREEVWANRYRCRLWPSLPLARRLEAVIRVVNNPLPFVRRLAFRLRRGRTESAVRLVIPSARPHRFARDALTASGRRGAQLTDAFWSSG